MYHKTSTKNSILFAIKPIAMLPFYLFVNIIYFISTSFTNTKKLIV